MRQEKAMNVQREDAICARGWKTRPGWYVVACRAGYEGEVLRRIEALSSQAARQQAGGIIEQDIVAFVPMERLTIRAGRGKSRPAHGVPASSWTVERPLMPGYLLVRAAMSAELYAAIARIRHAFGVLAATVGALPAPIDDGLAEALMLPFRAAFPSLMPGQQVRIVNPRFADVIGRVLTIDRHDRIKVIIPFMGASVPVSIPTDDVEPVVDGIRSRSSP